MANRFFKVLVVLLIAVSVSSQGIATVNKNKKPVLSKVNSFAKNKIELGFHFGKFYVDGDIPSSFKKGFGVGVHLRKAINYSFSLRSELFYGRAYGLSLYPWTHESYGGGLISPIFDMYSEEKEGWFPSYQTKYIYTNIEGLFNIGNILYHKRKPSWNLYVGVGIGVSNFSTKLDLLDSNDYPYKNLQKRVGWSEKEYNLYQGRTTIKKKLIEIYDGEYETPGPKKQGKFRLGNETNIDFFTNLSLGFSLRLNDRINLSLDQKIIFSANNLLDGIDNRTANDKTNQYDIPLYSSIRINYNIGKKSKLQPKYWRNPLSKILYEIDSLSNKARTISYKDSDKDGVPDFLDKEPHSLYGCDVNVKGVTIDSDGDGIIDCKDKYPFDPNNGKKTSSTNSDADIKSYVKTELDRLLKENYNSKASNTVTNWLLPIIYFDKDKFSLTNSSLVDLYRLTKLMNDNPELCLVVEGHADSSYTESYNESLSKKRAQQVIDYFVSKKIPKERFQLKFYGESRPIINSTNESDQVYNRRVEFHVCD